MKKTRVLIVEDNLVAQKMATMIIKSLGCEVDTADDGKAALEKYSHNNYDLILMDIGLPDIEGHEVTMKIREQEKNSRHVPIVALTAHANEEYKKKALDSGMDDFFPKPLTLDIAKKILQKYAK